MKEGRANSSSAADPPIPTPNRIALSRAPTADGFFSPSGRPRSDSAPVPKILEPPSAGTSVITTGRGMGGTTEGTGLLQAALSTSATSGGIEEEEESLTSASGSIQFNDEPTPGLALSARPTHLGFTGDGAGPLSSTLIDEGSDVDDDEIEEEEEGDLDDDTRELPDPALLSNRSSVLQPGDELRFQSIPIAPRHSISAPSALTALLNKHVPHLVSTSSVPMEDNVPASNPFASLYASVAALSNIPSISLELYFPHSESPTLPLICKARKDATVEEVTGFGLYKYWEESRSPLLVDQESEQRWSTVGWGLRIVEDDGEVDEDFPRESDIPLPCQVADTRSRREHLQSFEGQGDRLPVWPCLLPRTSFPAMSPETVFYHSAPADYVALDRESQISKFSYGQFAIVEANESQGELRCRISQLGIDDEARQNAVKAPTIQRRPSRIIAPAIRTRPSAQGRPSFPSPQPPPAASMSTSLSSDNEHLGSNLGSTFKGSVGLSSALSKTVLLRVRVTASADVHFTTTLSV